MTVNRRVFIAGLAAAGMAPAVSRAKSGMPGQLTLGEMQVMTLSDGHLTLPRSMLFAGLEPGAVDQILQARGVAAGAIHPPINVTLLRHAGRVVLFDAGSGPGFQSTAGQLTAALDTVGLAPDEVTHVVFTHCHPDHLWGVLDDFDDPLFPNAQYLMGEVEWEYWFDPNTASTISGDRASMAVGARRRLEAIEERLSRFGDGQEILPGVAAHASYGHTPGHMSFELRDGQKSALIGGDAIGNHHVSFAQPGWAIGTDQDVDLAAKTRFRLLDMLAHDQMQLIGYHLPNGGIGRVETAQNGYRFIPAN
ncbi:MBL fold metallo-hydrolase [Pseudophaeobacter sp. EL27]|uniref:MBL fold metallo-hydrolase n=1 Tax=Pseudophaeobacter sp. EL27 TaxID=2107580 RepID=UPI000EFBD1C5|nr:MBL fold metallo-hydrolase [Pseudophaeobacter sp. EL27]